MARPRGTEGLDLYAFAPLTNRSGFLPFSLSFLSFLKRVCYDIVDLIYIAPGELNHISSRLITSERDTRAM